MRSLGGRVTAAAQRGMALDTARDRVVGGLSVVRGFVPWRRATPRRVVRLGRTLVQHGSTLGALAAMAAIRDGRAIALVDDEGSVTAGQLDRWAATVAGELHSRGILSAGQRLGVLCDSGRGLATAALAASRLGADVVFVDTAIEGPDLARSLRTEAIHVLVHDEALAGTVAGARFRGRSIIADRSGAGMLSIREMAALPQATLPRPTRRGGIIVISRVAPGSTDGVRRDELDATFGARLAAMARRVDIEPGSPMAIDPPLFGGDGLTRWALAMSRGCPAVVRSAGRGPGE